MFKKIWERNEERWQALHSSLCRRHLSSVNPCPGTLHWDSTCIWALRLETGEQSRKLGHPYKQCQHRCPTHTWKRGKRTVHLWPLFLSFLISNILANPIDPNFKIDPYLTRFYLLHYHHVSINLSPELFQLFSLFLHLLSLIVYLPYNSQNNAFKTKACKARVIWFWIGSVRMISCGFFCFSFGGTTWLVGS